jgi:uncharacterized protein (TIGR03066 family)
MKPRTILVLVLSLFATLAAADPITKQAVVGKWSFTDDAMSATIELSANGKVKMEAKKKSMKRGAVGAGTYKLEDDKLVLQVIFDRMPKEATMKIVSIDAKTMVIDDRGETKTFTRTR